MARSQGWYLPHLRAWREDRIMTPKELADKAGIAPSVLSRLEYQRIRAGAHTLDKLRNALNLTRQQLIYEPPSAPKLEPDAA